jgi:hypothetical protein
MLKNIKRILRLDMVAHTCNPIYLGGRDQKDHGLRSAQVKSSRDPISTKKSWALWLAPVAEICEEHK